MDRMQDALLAGNAVCHAGGNKAAEVLITGQEDNSRDFLVANKLEQCVHGAWVSIPRVGM